MGYNLEKLRFVFEIIAFRSQMRKHFVLRIIDVVDDSGAVCFVYDASHVVEDGYIHVWIVDTADR